MFNIPQGHFPKLLHPFWDLNYYQYVDDTQINISSLDIHTCVFRQLSECYRGISNLGGLKMNLLYCYQIDINKWYNHLSGCQNASLGFISIFYQKAEESL